ncbi:hypothetical protein V2J09_010248 [Rumex salicifolius]
MMIGDPHHHFHTLTHNPTVYNPPWDLTSSKITAYNGNTSPPSAASSPTANNHEAILTALSRYLPSNVTEPDSLDLDDGYLNSDEFRMYEFKVRMCTRPKAHDWTECPFAHPGEKARRRDLRRYPYSGTACTDFRKGSCRRGDACEFAHGVFECWLHPTRYRTQACKDGPGCTRRVCFFAHSPGQLRVAIDDPMPGPTFDDDPAHKSFGSGSLKELVASIRNLQLSKVKSMPARPSWSLGSPGRFGSSGVRPGFFSLPTTPTQVNSGYLDTWENNQEPVLERVESGRELRVRMFEKLSKENPLSLSDPVDPGMSSGSGPDVGWVTDLVN